MTERFADPGDRYRLEERLATGGMGEVWWATDTVLHRDVAVKLLKPEYADNSEFRTRFTTEARHAASLHHPGVAAVFDFGDDPDRPAYIVMELVDGQPLDRLLKPGVPMPSAVARDLVSQTAEALAAAHAAGIVHRDVKPGNLLVTGERQVKVTDFGIARATEAVPVTQTGQIVGTPQYISPEQATGKKATAASDVYGLGVVLYECLAGHRPFVADNPVAIALAHVREPVPPLPASVPPDLAAVTMRALDKDPEKRYADAAAFAAALQALASPDAAAAAAAAAFVQPPVPAGGPAPGTTVLSGGGAVPSPAPVGGAGDQTDHVRGRRTAWLAAVPLLLAAGMVIWLLGAGEDPTEVAASDPPSPTASQTPQKVQLDPDDYVGRPVDRVAADLGELDLEVRRAVVENPGGHRAGRVTALEPVTGLVEGDTVTVRFWGEPPPAPDPAPAPDGGNDGGGDGAPGKSGPGGPGKGDNKGGPGKGRPGKGKGR